MNDTITLTPYEHACSDCIDDLYHTAYIALGDETAAETLVTRICVAGVHRYRCLTDEREIRFRLTSELYHRVKRRLLFTAPNTDGLAEELRVLTGQERLLSALAFSSGLTMDEVGRIIGLSREEYERRIDGIAAKSLGRRLVPQR